jgi:hypothetical protein
MIQGTWEFDKPNLLLLIWKGPKTDVKEGVAS